MTVADTPIQTGGGYSLRHWRQAWLTIDQNPAAQNWAASWFGKMAVHLAVVAAMALSFQFSTPALALISVTLFAIALMPTWRMPLIVGSSLFYLFLRPFRIDGWTELVKSKAELLPLAGSIPQLGLQAGGVFVVVFFAVMFLGWQKANPDRQAAKRPVLALLAIWASLLIAALATPENSIASAGLWSIVGVFISCFWFLAYAAVDQKTKDATPTLARAGFLRPFWGGSATPIGKNFGYLNKFDAENEQELAVTRLKGMKLAVWALILTGVVRLVETGLTDTLAVPSLQSAVLAHAAGCRATNKVRTSVNQDDNAGVVARKEGVARLER